jgi:hypothetical protein
VLAVAALADSHHRRIVEMLTERELPSGQTGERFEISASPVLQHLQSECLTTVAD